MNEDSFESDDIQPHGFSLEEESDKRGKKIRLWIIGVLSAVVLILFVIERYVTVIKPKMDVISITKGKESIRNLDGDLREMFDSYGIKQSWIMMRDVNLPASKKVRLEWIVKIPWDIPVATVTYDINTLVKTYDMSAYAVEDTKLGEIAVHVESNRKVYHSLIFIRSKDIKRQAAPISIMVDGIENAPDVEVGQFFGMSEPIACVMQAKRESRTLYSKLVDAKKEIILHIHFLPGKETESKFEFSEDLPEKMISGRVKNILKEFPRAEGFYITSERAIGNAASIAEEELLHSNLIKIPTADIQYIDRGSSFSQMSSRMNDIATLSVKNKYAIGVLELRANTISFLTKEFMRLRKRGFTFIRCTQLFQTQAAVAELK